MTVEDPKFLVRRLVAIYKPRAREGMNPREMHHELGAIDAPRRLAEKEIEEVVCEAFHFRNIHGYN